MFKRTSTLKSKRFDEIELLNILGEKEGNQSGER